MKSIQVHKFGPAELMQYEEVAKLKPGKQQIKIAVKAIGVNPVDTYIRAGIYPIKPDLPYTPGKDSAGIITEIGSEVTLKKVGDRVYTCGCISGSYAEELICDEDQAFILPENCSFATGAALGVPYSTAYIALNSRARAVEGEIVLIHGASGAVGLAAIQIAKSIGLRVIGTAGTEKGLKLLWDQGVIAALNHNQDNYLDSVSDLTAGVGVDIVLEMLANVNLDKDLKLLAPNGRVVIIGSRGTIEIDPRDTMGKNTSILGMSLFNTPPAQLQQIHQAIKAGLINRCYRPVIHSEFPLADAAKAHDLVMMNGVNGKIILIP